MVDIGPTRYAQSGDVSVAYQVVGDGPRDLVYVPGIISHVEFFHELPGYTDFLAQLARFARVIVFDKRGNGLSDRIDGAATLEDRMDDLRAVMDAVGSERATLFAVSEGGPISLLFAATHPARVESMVLYETFVRYGGVDGHTEVVEADEHREFTDFLLEAYGSGASLNGFGSSLADDERVREMWGRAERMSNSPGGFRAVFEALHSTDVRSVLPSVQVPCLVISASDGMSMFEQHSKYLASHVPEARRVSLPGVDHFPWWSGADRIVAEVEAFVTGSEGRAVGDRIMTTMLFTDVVGSTELASSLGDHKWTTKLEQYYGLVRRNLTRFRGVEVNTEGDGFLARFDGPARAVACARAIRDGVHGLGLQVRAGVHAGEVEVIDDDIAGLAVHIGSRITQFAESDEILVSRTVRDLTVGSSLEFVSRGSHTLKGVPDEWEIFLVT